jgi:cytochrome c biogenesis protein CcmG, thiol:disulfide interchange protein DsbE
MRRPPSNLRNVRLSGALRLLLLLAAQACGGASHAGAPSASSPHLGKAAPTFKRGTLAGTTFDLQAQRGHATVVKFAANYCVPCKKSLPALEALHSAQPNLAMVVIAEDERESEARALVQATGITMPVVHDAGNILAARYRVHDLPITFVVNADGEIVWVGDSTQSEGDLETAIAAAQKRSP